MSDKILVSVAWPYANADIHVGNIVGSHLPADIFARYHRLRGDEVLMVSGTDSHGTPVTVRADAEQTTPLAVYDGLEGWDGLSEQVPCDGHAILFDGAIGSINLSRDLAPELIRAASEVDRDVEEVLLPKWLAQRGITERVPV